VSVRLLDVNLLVALVWPAHEAHETVMAWFARTARGGWATCPLTQAGFVRILANPAFHRDAVSPSEATKVLQANLRHPSHRFWPMDVEFPAAVAPLAGQIAGHRQITDAYLLGLVIRNEGILATLDRSLPALLPDMKLRSRFVEVVGPPHSATHSKRETSGPRP